MVLRITEGDGSEEELEKITPFHSDKQLIPDVQLQLHSLVKEMETLRNSLASTVRRYQHLHNQIVPIMEKIMKEKFMDEEERILEEQKKKKMEEEKSNKFEYKEPKQVVKNDDANIGIQKLEFLPLRSSENDDAIVACGCKKESIPTIDVLPSEKTRGRKGINRVK